MKKHLTLLLLVISTITYGQSLSEKEIIGTWEVEKISGDFPKMSGEQQKRMDALKAAFLGATFDFKEDRTFNFNIEFMKELDEMMKNVHWKFNTNNTEVIIQEWKDKDTDSYQLMGINVSKKNGIVYFIMAESPFVLEMKKK